MTAILVDAALKATVVLTAALLLDLVLRRGPAADRHLVWTVAAAATLALPPLGATVPSAHWPAVPVAWAGAPGTPLDDRPVRERSAPGAEGLETRVEETVVRTSDRPADGAGPGGAEAAGGGAARTKRADGPARSDVTAGARTAAGAGPATAAGPDPPAGGPSRPWWVLAWALGAGAVLVRLTLQAGRCARLRRRTHPFGPGRVRSTAREVAAEVGLDRLPLLLRGPADAMPSTWGLLRRRLLLPDGAAAWSAERLRGVLAHELAHLRRRDGAAQLVAAAACAVYWFHPLAWVAARRMAEERELACDDEVLGLGARPSGYARCLVELAREGRARPLAGAVATSMARPAGLGRRVDSVLAAGRRRSGLSGRRATLFGVAGALLVVPVATLQPLAQARLPETPREPRPADGAVFRYPGPSTAHDGQEADPCWAPDVSHSMNVHRSDGEHRLRWEGAGCVSEILVRGTPTFDEDFDAVTGLSEGGLVRIEERAGGTRRSVEMRPDGDGGVTRTFRRDGRVREPGAGDRAWIAARVVTLLRQTGLAAGDRVAWILSREGPDGVFREVERVRSDRGQALYLGELVDRAELDDGALRRLLRTAGDRIGSDGRLTGLLERVVRAAPDRVAGSHRDAFREAASHVGSDGDMTRLLLAMMEARPDDAATARLALEIAAGGVGSDGDMTRVLVRAAGLSPDLVTGELRRAYLAAAGTVGSDGDVRRALTRLVAGAGGDPALTALALDVAADGLGSDGDMAGFLVAVARASGGGLADPALRERYLRALSTVGSDGDERRARRALERALDARG